VAVATAGSSPLPAAAPQTDIINILNGLVTTLGQLVQVLQAQASATAQGGGPGQATAGAAQVDPAAAPAQAPSQDAAPAGGCGCCGGGDALSGANLADTAPAKAGKHGKHKGKNGSDGPPAPPSVPSNAKPGGGPAPAASKKPSGQGEIDSYIKYAAGVYGADAKVLRNIAEKESSFNPDAINKTDSNAQAGHPSEGMFQFIPTTFADYAAKAKAAKPEAWANLGPLDFHDWRQQALATAWAIQNGHGSAWATFGAAKAAA
jgi:hypothetical protein